MALTLMTKALLRSKSKQTETQPALPVSPAETQLCLLALKVAQTRRISQVAVTFATSSRIQIIGEAILQTTGNNSIKIRANHRCLKIQTSGPITMPTSKEA